MAYNANFRVKNADIEFGDLWPEQMFLLGSILAK